MIEEKKPIRVAIASDHAIFRRGLASLVMALKDLQLVGEARDGEEALQLCELVKPDLLLLDLHKPLASGGDPARQAHLRWPAMKVVCMISSGAEPNRLQPENSHVEVYTLSKEISEKDFQESLHQIFHGSAAQHPVTPAQARAEQLQLLLEELQSGPIDRATLGALLHHYLPVIFPQAQIFVRLFPGHDLVAIPSLSSSPSAEVGLRWLRTISESSYFIPGAELPWGTRQPQGSTFLLSPILRGRQSIGGLCIIAPGGAETVERLLDQMDTLSTRLADVLEPGAEIVIEGKGEVLSRELVMAGKIQADILPDREPHYPGWDFAARLEPARETSGDFYDFITLANRNLGIVIADVTDKGMGAALFMALSNTLIRTYAAQYPTLPALAVGAVNERILNDTRGNMFVTAFYGVLEPHTGRLRFVNAGHPPAHLLTTQRGRTIERLRSTGMALGVMENVYWQQKVVKMQPGDTLLLYTDGVTEAMNSQGDYFGEDRLMEILYNKKGCSARETLQAVLDQVHQFVGESPRQDDIALIVLCRKE